MMSVSVLPCRVVQVQHNEALCGYKAATPTHQLLLFRGRYKKFRVYAIIIICNMTS